MSIYNGFQVVVVNPRPLPIKRHIKKPHMSEAYHRRIQKKWDKRWGTEDASMFRGVVFDREDRVVYVTPDGAEKIKRALS